MIIIMPSNFAAVMKIWYGFKPPGGVTETMYREDKAYTIAVPEINLRVRIGSFKLSHSVQRRQFSPRPLLQIVKNSSRKAIG